MTTLHLRPLPSFRSEEVSSAPDFGGQDFVDEAVVMALVAGPIASRERISVPADLVLPADEMDFAGWSLSPIPVVRESKPKTSPPPASPTARPSPPVLRELGIGEPHQGSHRWWLAGLAGAISTLLVTSLLMYLSSRNSPQTESSVTVESPSKLRPSVSDAQSLPRKPGPQWTDVSPDRLAIDP